MKSQKANAATRPSSDSLNDENAPIAQPVLAKRTAMTRLASALTAATNGNVKAPPIAKQSALRDISNLPDSSKLKITKFPSAATKSAPPPSVPNPSPKRRKLPAADTAVQDFHNYQCEILSYLTSAEKKFQPNPTCMDWQPEINAAMRAILVSWLMDVTADFHFHSKTLYLAVNYIDRYLSRKGIMKKFLQLLGVSCLLIASKVEEKHGCLVSDLVDVCDRCYTNREVLLMERKVLDVIEFELCAPTIACVTEILLPLLIENPHDDGRMKALCALITDICALKHSLLKYRTSQLSMAIVYVAFDTFNKMTSSTIAQQFRYIDMNYNDIVPCILDVHAAYFESWTQKSYPSLFNRYSNGANESVGQIIPKEKPIIIIDLNSTK